MARFVLFDLFNTLVDGADHDRNRIDNREHVAAEMARTVGVDPMGLIDAFNATWRQRQTEWSIEDTVRILTERLGGTASADQVKEAAALRRAFGHRVLATVTESTIEVLGAIRGAGYRLGLVSNASADASEAWPDSTLARYLDVAIFSCEVRLAKPDAGIYLAATSALGADPADCVYVGDGADWELPGAAALRMTVYRTTEHADSDPSWQGPVIEHLADLPPLLGAADAT